MYNTLVKARVTDPVVVVHQAMDPTVLQTEIDSPQIYGPETDAIHEEMKEERT